MVWGRNDAEPIEVTPILFLTGLVTTPGISEKKTKFKKEKQYPECNLVAPTQGVSPRFFIIIHAKVAVDQGIHSSTVSVNTDSCKQ